MVRQYLGALGNSSVGKELAVQKKKKKLRSFPRTSLKSVGTHS